MLSIKPFNRLESNTQYETSIIIQHEPSHNMICYEKNLCTRFTTI
ncbi:hypothetical protein EMIT079MI2_30063 [Bacillus sp. IT-79MI2]